MLAKDLYLYAYLCRVLKLLVFLCTSSPRHSHIFKTLTIKYRNEAFMRLDKFLTIMEERELYGGHISQVQKDTACYRNLYQKKKKMDGT